MPALFLPSSFCVQPTLRKSGEGQGTQLRGSFGMNAKG